MAAKQCYLPCQSLRFDCSQKCTTLTSAFSCVTVDTSASSANLAACDAPSGPRLGCDVPDYVCQSVCFALSTSSSTNATSFQFLIPFGRFQSNQEKAMVDSAAAWWRTQIETLPVGNNEVPYLNNDYLMRLDPFVFPSSIASVVIAGGYRDDVGIKGKVANVTVADALFADAASVASVTFASLNLGETAPNLLELLPANVTTLRLFNCLYAAVPNAVSRLTQLKTLNLSHNYIETVPSTFTLPSLLALDLAFNNITTFEPSPLTALDSLDLRGNALTAIPDVVYSLPQLKRLRISGNPLRVAAVTTEQFAFLSGLRLLEIDAFQYQVECKSGNQSPVAGRSDVTVCVTTAEELKKLKIIEPSTSTTMIVAVATGVVAVVAVLLLVWMCWRRRRRQLSDKQAVSSALHQTTQLELDESDGGDYVKCNQDHEAAIAIAQLVPSSVTVSNAVSSPNDAAARVLHSTSSIESIDSTSTYNSVTTSSSSLPFTRSLLVRGRMNSNGSLHGRSLWDDDDLRARQLLFDDIQDVRLIGSGAHGVVWLVRYRETRLLASKRLVSDQLTRQQTYDFVTEIKLCSKLRHPSIVQLVGVAWTIESDLQALFEYMPNGDLRTVLEYSEPGVERRSPSARQLATIDPSQPKMLSWINSKWQLALSVVETLVYVHSFDPPLVHRDLKARNVLLDEAMKAKLSDFGVSRFESENGTMTTGVGTGKWLAPEVISGSNTYDASCDIFAFGVLLSELDTHRLPYDDVRGAHGDRLPEIAILQLVAANELRPALSDTCPREIQELASECMAQDRTARPTAVDIAFRLRLFGRKHGFYGELYSEN